MIIDRKVSSIESSFQMENMLFDEECRKRVKDVLTKNMPVVDAIAELNKKYSVLAKKRRIKSIMCYLVAKDRYAHGCFALKTTHGKHLAELKSELDQVVGYKGVQLIVISRPTAYGEYAPYHFVNTEQEFRSLVKGLRP